jgi:hypothetical protein
LTLAGRVFSGATTYAGVTLPIYNATAHTFGLFNPANSGRNLMLLSISVSQSDATTPAISGLALSYIGGLGSAAATGTGLTALTETVPTSGMIGQTHRRVGQFTLAATTTATSLFRVLGFSQDSVTPGTGLVSSFRNFEGEIIVPPGVFIALTGAPVAPGQDFCGTLTWAELDLPS